MKLTFQQAFKALTDCSAVIWSDGFLSYPALRDEDTDDADKDMFLSLAIMDDEGQVFDALFYRGDNLSVEAEGSSLFLFDSEREQVQVTLLAPVKL